MPETSVLTVWLDRTKDGGPLSCSSLGQTGGREGGEEQEEEESPPEDGTGGREGGEEQEEEESPPEDGESLRTGLTKLSDDSEDTDMLSTDCVRFLGGAGCAMGAGEHPSECKTKVQKHFTHVTSFDQKVHSLMST